MKKECENCQIIKNIKNYTKIDYTIGLVGNPNVGKSTLFNYLTGMNVRVGNWPGKTVSKIEGFFEFKTPNNKYVFKIIDLPGVYSIFSFTPEEEVTRNFLFLGSYDIALIVLDATNLEKNLILVFQTFEITSKVILTLNLIDEAKRKGIIIDIEKLESKLKVPIIPIIASTGYNTDLLIYRALEIIQGKITITPAKYNQPPELEQIIEELKQEILEYYPELQNHPALKWITLRILEGDKFIIEMIRKKAIKINSYQNTKTKLPDLLII
ncbi:MAG: 50S ribosome-binding GTPase [bacterium]|nr:50S ribosome-binding GTPase [bacterium]